MLVQFLILTLVETVLTIFFVIGIQINYSDKLVEITKAFKEDIKDELYDKRTYKKQVEKLLEERDKLLERIIYMRNEIKTNKIFKKLYYIYKKEKQGKQDGKNELK